MGVDDFNIYADYVIDVIAEIRAVWVMFLVYYIVVAVLFPELGQTTVTWSKSFVLAIVVFVNLGVNVHQEPSHCFDPGGIKTSESEFASSLTQLKHSLQSSTKTLPGKHIRYVLTNG